VNVFPELRAVFEQATTRVLARHIAELRAAAEGYWTVEDRWLQRALFEELSRCRDIQVAQQVSIVDGASTKVVDLVLSRGQLRLLVELKVFVANYGRGGRCVTDSRGAIKADLAALGRRVDATTQGCVLWLAYPIPEEREGDWNAKHLRDVRPASADTRRWGAPINVGRAYVHVYVSDAKAVAVALVA
jgi:hypothetical protein